MSELLNIIKKAGIDAVNNGSPCAVMFGEVTSEEPLKIKVDQRLVLGEKQLIFPAALQKSPLEIGDSVILLRMQGGQKFVVLDRILDKKEAGT